MDISVTRQGLTGGMNVPAENADQMIRSSVLVAGPFACAAGPIVLLRTGGGLGMPWVFEFVLALVLAVTPIAHLVFGNRRGEG
ncbi:hypothetical protein [Kitasatospora kifunensis]|uniref:Uncharacterized protein n=1 Tax=Kitasatospora kifunensis TaxID=58351 RepID=A0A7W7VZR8_KITKI|nr:hypothetical protein [Kitasatospora kifunensis]MBB4928846.1 hypothetical protein [Kitasatospora kifunensis]